MDERMGFKDLLNRLTRSEFLQDEFKLSSLTSLRRAT